jgi:hypothetical protein
MRGKQQKPVEPAAIAGILAEVFANLADRCAAAGQKEAAVAAREVSAIFGVGGEGKAGAAPANGKKTKTEGEEK